MKNNREEILGGGVFSVELIIYILFFLTANVLDWITVLSDGGIFNNYILMLVICVCTIAGIAVFIKEKKLRLYLIMDKADCIPLGILLLLAVIRITIPDTSYDTLNYHLFWQDSFGSDIINYHFFPTRVINSLFFCLGDRTFYIFRSLLGYRIGVLLGVITVMIMYLQSKLFLKVVYSIITGRTLEEPRKGEKLFITVTAFLCVTAEQMIIELDTYYVDLLAVPFIIEALFRVLFIEKQESIDLCILGIMAGVCICIKPYNLVWIVLILLLYLYKFGKGDRWEGWALGVVSALLVCFPYIFLSYRMTNNPVFPYMNAIFKSDWFFLKGVDEYSGMKELFGPSTLKEYLFWPYYMTFLPENIHFSDYPVYRGRILVALVFSIFSMFHIMWNKRSLLIKINCIFIVCYILYLTCMNGHLRYSLFLEWYAGIVLMMAIIYIFAADYGKIWKMGFIVMCLMPMAFSVQWLYNYTFSSTDCVARQSLFENKDNWIKNGKYIFHDYGKQEMETANAAGFIVFDTNGSMMSMLDASVPVVNIKSGALTKIAKEKCEAVLYSIQERGTIYSLSKPNGLEQLLKEMEISGYSVSAIKTVKLPKIASVNTLCYLVSVDQEAKGMIVCEGDELQEGVEIDAQLAAGKTFKVFVGRKWGDMASDSTTKLKIMADENKEAEVSFDSVGNFYLYEVQISDSMEESVKIELDSDSFLNKWMVVEY